MLKKQYLSRITTRLGKFEEKTGLHPRVTPMLHRSMLLGEVDRQDIIAFSRRENIFFRLFFIQHHINTNYNMYAIHLPSAVSQEVRLFILHIKTKLAALSPLIFIVGYIRTI
jgi:hypothetical protein